MIEVYVNDIKRSLENECYFAALSLALTLPDMCGMAEYPNESLVGKRYIDWYNKYLGGYMAPVRGDLCENNPWLNGEIIYNLRNTFLHQGSPNVISSKVKDEANQIDRFVLVLGDGTEIWDSTLNIDMGHGKVTFKLILVDITFLCNNLCDVALWYYQNNKDGFKFHFSVLTQEEFMNPPKENLEGDILVKVLNKKLADTGSTMRIVEDPKHNPLDSIKKGLDIIFSNEDTKQRFLSGETTFTFEKPSSHKKIDVVPVTNKKTAENSKPVRKEEQQVNNNLMKHFSNEEVSIIYQRLQPLLKNMPGK